MAQEMHVREFRRRTPREKYLCLEFGAGSWGWLWERGSSVNPMVVQWTVMEIGREFVQEPTRWEVQRNLKRAEIITLFSGGG